MFARYAFSPGYCHDASKPSNLLRFYNLQNNMSGPMPKDDMVQVGALINQMNNLQYALGMRENLCLGSFSITGNR